MGIVNMGLETILTTKWLLTASAKEGRLEPCLAIRAVGELARRHGSNLRTGGPANRTARQYQEEPGAKAVPTDGETAKDGPSGQPSRKGPSASSIAH
jgi:hypothetical protein